MTYKLISFDVFDTLITRRVGQPFGIFSLMENELQKMNFPELLCKDFLTIRIEAEAKERWFKNQTSGHKEITLDDIYSVIARNYNLNNIDLERIKKLEISTEKNNLVIIPKTFEILKKYIFDGYRVVLISDMYLSSKTIKEILINIDNIFNKIPVYSSSDFSFSKSEGKLFEIIKEIEDIEYQEWKHFGDNEHSDINIPKKYGIITEKVEKHYLYKYESYLYDRYFYNNETIEVSIGAARLARIKGNQNSFYNFGASFSAPILYNYIDFVINYALKNSVKNLYFIARDGFVLKKIADLIITKRKINIKTTYIYGSRTAWRIPNEHNIDQYISMILDEYKDRLSIEFIANRMQVPVELLSKAFNISDCKRIISNSEIINIKNNINDFAKNEILMAMSKRREIAKKYLDNLIGDEKIVYFVDMHGSGRTLDIMAETFFQNEKKLKSFFMTSWVSSQSNEIEKITFYESIRFSHFWVELLCRAPHGQTIGYEFKGNDIVPILEKSYSKIEWQYDEYLNGILAYTNEILDTCKYNCRLFSDIEIYKGFYDFFFNHLDRKTAKIMSKIPYYMIGDESKLSLAAKPYHSISAIKNFILNKGVPTSTFPNISFVLSSKRAKKFVQLIWKYKSLKQYFKYKLNKLL